MTGREVLIPCPHCRAVVRCRTRPDGRPAANRCVVCSGVFPPPLLEAVRAFLVESFGELEPIGMGAGGIGEPVPEAEPDLG